MANPKHDDSIKSKACEMYINGVPPKEIQEQFGIPARTLQNWVKDYKLIGVREVETLKAEGKDIYDQERTGMILVNRTLDHLNMISKEVEKKIREEGLTETTMKALKLIGDTTDKLVRLEIFKKSGGVSKKEIKVHTKEEKIDWNALIESTMKAKAKNPDFDDAEFAKEVIETTFKKVEDEE